MLDVEPLLGSHAPIVANIHDALTLGPTSLLIGVATAGGFIPPQYRAALLRAIDAGLEIVSGLHDLLAADAEFTERQRRRHGREVGGASAFRYCTVILAIIPPSS